MNKHTRHKCIVKSCGSCGPPLFTIKKENIVLWKELIGIPSTTKIPLYSEICAKHFRKEEFMNPRRLHSFAKPTLFLDRKDDTNNGQNEGGQMDVGSNDVKVDLGMICDEYAEEHTPPVTFTPVLIKKLHEEVVIEKLQEENSILKLQLAEKNEKLKMSDEEQNEESGAAPKKICVNSPSDGRKIIFRDEFYIEVEKISDKTTCGKCVVCHRVIRGSGQVTSNFIKHLQVKHNELFKKYKSYKAGSSDGGIAQTDFDDKLLHAIIDSSLPLSVLENKSFIELFETTGMKVLSKQRAANKLDRKFTIMVQNIKEILFYSEYVCTTADIWSRGDKCFLGYTCHWLTNNLERRSAALAYRRIYGEHTAEKIAQMITEINTNFGLNSSKIILPVFDYERWLPSYTRCCSHTLNLLASTDFDEILKTEQPLLALHRMAFDKCNNLWQRCKWPKYREIIQVLLGSSLLLPVVTRWNLLYDAVQQLLCYKEKLNNLCDKLSLPHFSPADLQYLEMYKLIMEPIAHALDFLQEENNINYGFLIPTLLTLCNRLNKLSRIQELQQISPVIVKMEQRLRERFQPYFMLQPEANIAIAATVLTPSIKMKWLKAWQQLSLELSELTIEHITDRVLDTLYSFYAKNSNTFNCEIKNHNLSTLPDFFDFSNNEDGSDTTISTPNLIKIDRRSTIKHQLFNYLTDNSSADEIWQKYALLKEAFIFFNTPLTSSAPVERLFSFAGIVDSPRRESLSEFSFEKLVLMKFNSKYT